MNDKDRPMPPLIAFAGALGGLAVVRWAYRTAQRVNRELEEARVARVAEALRSSDIPTLRQDPVTGAYRPGYRVRFRRLRRVGLAGVRPGVGLSPWLPAPPSRRSRAL